MTDSPARLFTALGTVLYVDMASGLLSHGPVESSPANAFLVPNGSLKGPGRQAQFVLVADNSSKPIGRCTDTQLSVDTAHSAAESSEAVLFDVIPLERGLFALRQGNVFLTAVPDGQIRFDASTCSTWELF